MGGAAADLKLIGYSGYGSIRCGTKATVIRNRVATAVNPLARNSPERTISGLTVWLKCLKPKMFEVAIYSIVVMPSPIRRFFGAWVAVPTYCMANSSRHLQARNLQPKPRIHPGYRSLSEIAVADIERDLCESGN